MINWREKRQTINIAVIADFKGFKYLTSEIETYKEPEMPYMIKFHLIDDEEKCRGAVFNSYITHYSGKRLPNYYDILLRVKSRIIKIG